MKTIKFWSLSMIMLATLFLTSCSSEPGYADPEAHEKTEQLREQYTPFIVGTWHIERIGDNMGTQRKGRGWEPIVPIWRLRWNRYCYLFALQHTSSFRLCRCYHITFCRLLAGQRRLDNLRARRGETEFLTRRVMPYSRPADRISAVDGAGFYN